MINVVDYLHDVRLKKGNMKTFKNMVVVLALAVMSASMAFSCDCTRRWVENTKVVGNAVVTHVTPPESQGCTVVVDAVWGAVQSFGNQPGFSNSIQLWVGGQPTNDQEAAVPQGSGLPRLFDMPAATPAANGVGTELYSQYFPGLDIPVYPVTIHPLSVGVTSIGKLTPDVTLFFNYSGPGASRTDANVMEGLVLTGHYELPATGKRDKD
jgi:hypothetical protein